MGVGILGSSDLAPALDDIAHHSKIRKTYDNPHPGMEGVRITKKLVHEAHGKCIR